MPFVLFFRHSSLLFVFFFFFSSRRRHTRYIGDWSSDVCSSDLLLGATYRFNSSRPHSVETGGRSRRSPRSEERRVGKECRSRWSRYHQKKKRREGRRRCRGWRCEE